MTDARRFSWQGLQHFNGVRISGPRLTQLLRSPFYGVVSFGFVLTSRSS